MNKYFASIADVLLAILCTYNFYLFYLL